MSANVVSPENLEQTSASIYDDILSLNSKMNDTIERLTALSNTTATKSEVNGMVKSVNLNGRTLTVTKGDGSSSTFTTVDNNTTYGLATKTASGLQSADDKKRFDTYHYEAFCVTVPNGATYIKNNPIKISFKKAFLNDNFAITLGVRNITTEPGANYLLIGGAYNNLYKFTTLTTTGLEMTSASTNGDYGPVTHYSFICADMYSY